MLSRVPAGIHVKIDLAYEDADDRESVEDRNQVSSAGLMVPYPLLAKSGPVALEMALQIAEHLGWTVYDPQGDCELSRASIPEALALQRSSGAAARSVLEAAAAAETSLGDIFLQELWNYSLVSAAVAFVSATVLSIWLMFTLEWPKERFDKYLPWFVAIGGIVFLWLKSLVQASRAYRDLRRKSGA